MSEVKTLVYFDLEATGLKSSGRPRICEISFVAVNIEDVLQLGLRLNEDRSLCEISFLPRIVNKLTLCVYPMAIIVPLVSDLTGLDNYNLSGQSNFTNTTANLLNSFLSHLPSPVCLVAHNGNAYDFPLLKAELEKLGTELNPGTLCVDSLLGFRELLQKQGKSERTNHANINYKEIKAKEIYVATELVKAGMFEADMFEGHSESLDKESSKILQADSEVTPSKGIKTVVQNLKPSKHAHIPHSEKLKTRKKLTYLNQSTPTSFTLGNLHKHLLGVAPSQSHGAEADCLALLRTSAVLGEDWIKWVRNNSYSFSKCKKMWG